MFCPYVVNLAAQPNYGTIKGQSFMLLQRLGPSIRDLLEKGHPFTEDIVIHVLQCAVSSSCIGLWVRLRLTFLSQESRPQDCS